MRLCPRRQHPGTTNPRECARGDTTTSLPPVRSWGARRVCPPRENPRGSPSPSSARQGKGDGGWIGVPLPAPGTTQAPPPPRGSRPRRPGGAPRAEGAAQPRPRPREGRVFPGRPPLLPGETHGARAPRVAPGDRARARAHPKSSSMDLK